MFTGIIEEVGTVQSLSKKSADAMEIVIQCSRVLEDVHLGDSIAINGVCLTVTGFTKAQFAADVMPETVKATSLDQLTSGSPVNIERAMSSNGRFGGHFVSGHVDGTAVITRIEKKSNAIYYDLEMDKTLTDMLTQKGSIAIDGVSLTIFDLQDSHVTVSIIPHTLEGTIFPTKSMGEIVNIECDMIGKYIYRFLTKEQGEKQPSRLTPTFLKEHGF
ncbi:Riboflavin synthase eubacterial/eukaryotic [Bacillus pumilus]|uniref:riboflavin synthase n=1 Tax=Bacillus pumilus TaxID=1408 RepID=UPI000DC5168C|nr:riboflavin synthase [Bacillus pumilus]RAP20590.1 Riboflavin synthase eubacterial/eukaryotic [Bacillus pumilus]